MKNIKLNKYSNIERNKFENEIKIKKIFFFFFFFFSKIVVISKNNLNLQNATLIHEIKKKDKSFNNEINEFINKNTFVSTLQFSKLCFIPSKYLLPLRSLEG